MPRPTSPQSESDSERVSSKKQKKRVESPVDDPMDEDGVEKEAVEDDDDEYEIERIMDSSTTIFKDGETAYFVKWKGYPENENSWVRESDAPNADELISKFLDEKRAREKAASGKKATTKPRKSAEPPKQDPKKRGRVSTKSKAQSDEEEPERSPVHPIAKKQRKAPAPAKKKGKDLEEDLDEGEFASMDKYMHLDSWDTLVDKIDTIERDEDGHLILYGTLTTKEHFRLPSTTANVRFPQKIIKFYEGNLRWKSSDETA
ncbi:hypothetical protein BDM02DRAFT_1512793 [Thelephora ganbajun]|uniref:Uncharacterized protein n=1 Tax=Thelephora ganbajun TaxID=370292 RepID=A0ACB6ZJX7_THEGA|nr:hypothetical protein BDM02DRAFT_1512793 [Thelephora ganbajun]